MGLPLASVPSAVTFVFPNVLLKVTVLNFVVPGVIFDLASFSFQVPICGSAAKHAAPAKKPNTKVNPMVLIFMRAIETGFRRRVNIFPSYQALTDQQSPTGSIVPDCGSEADTE